jgi:hypothetical protein
VWSRDPAIKYLLRSGAELLFIRLVARDRVNSNCNYGRGVVTRVEKSFGQKVRGFTVGSVFLCVSMFFLSSFYLCCFIVGESADGGVQVNDLSRMDQGVTF